jgi:hypothetical protein
MIKFPTTESPVKCSCGQPAIRRTVPASYGGKGGRMVSFDTHARAMTDSEFLAALGRLDAFHEKLYALQSGLKATSEDERKVATDDIVGRLISFDIETVHPDACHIRTQVIPTAVVQCFGVKKVVKLEARDLDGQTVGSVLAELKTAAEPIILMVKRQKAEGDY